MMCRRQRVVNGVIFGAAKKVTATVDWRQARIDRRRHETDGYQPLHNVFMLIS